MGGQEGQEGQEKGREEGGHNGARQVRLMVYGVVEDKRRG